MRHRIGGKVILAVAMFMFLGFLTLAVVGVREAQLGVHGFATERDYLSGSEGDELAAVHPDGWTSRAIPLDAVEASRFTSSLLSLSKAQTRPQHSSPAHAHDESSSLASVRQPQLKNPSQES
jgi:hypothetical protein